MKPGELRFRAENAQFQLRSNLPSRTVLKSGTPDIRKFFAIEAVLAPVLHAIPFSLEAEPSRRRPFLPAKLRFTGDIAVTKFDFTI